jgi:long-chain acyl-CoA synthetase
MSDNAVPSPTTATENILPETASLIHHARSTSTRPHENRMVPYRSIGELLSKRAVEHPGKNWLTFYTDDGKNQEFTYREFEESALRMAALMAGKFGLRTGDRVATLMLNDPRTVLVYFGAWLVGLTVVPVNCGEDDDRVQYILENSRAKAVFAWPDQVARCESIRASCPDVRNWVVTDDSEQPGWVLLDSSLESVTALADLPDVSPNTECLIVYTSGTTGAPKGVVLDQYNLLADADSIASWHRFGADDRAMCVLPIHHVNGTVVTLVTPLYSGGSVVLNRRFRAQSFWQTLADERCTWCSVVPTVLAFLCERAEDLSQRDLSAFRHIICGAGPLTVELARRFDETFGVRVVHGYGLSETTCYSCFLPVGLTPDAYAHWMFECGFPSIGCPVPANEMVIHDSEGNPLAQDARGEIVIRGHNVMRYYFQRPDANRDTFAHGWFRSGDEGFYRVGEDGRDYYFITGRLKELIIRGGVNYSPFDIDEVLCRAPGVKAAMAVGFENDFYGEEVGAYVQRAEGSTVTADDIIAFCRAELPYSKSPKVVIFGETFPVTSTGKYQRNKLKPLFAEWKGARFRGPRR